MKRRTALAVVICGSAMAAAAAAAAAPRPAAWPDVNLQVDLRVIDEAVANGHGDYTVSTRGTAQPAAPALQLQVQNGHSGSLQLGRALPVQWLQGAARGAAAPSSAAGPADRAGAVDYAVTWVQAGQSLTLRPNWPGGDSPVTLELQFSRSTVQTAPAAALPTTRSLQAGSTLRLPLGAWTTFAATGVPQAAGEPGRVSTWSLAERGRQLMQVRVSLP